MERAHRPFVTQAPEADARLPTAFGDFRIRAFRDPSDGKEHAVLYLGDLTEGSPMVRVHSECLTGDAFHSKRCDCGPQLHASMKAIQERGVGAIAYMRQEGRGIGLASKIKAYKLQEEGLDTVDANLKLGYGMDLREYGIGAQILVDLGLQSIRLLTNNPKKMVGLEGYGLKVDEQLPITVEPNPHNERYLETKKSRMGHML